MQKPPFLGVSECDNGVRTPDRALAKLILIESNGKRTLDEQCDSLGVFLLYKMQIIIETNYRGTYGESI